MKVFKWLLPAQFFFNVIYPFLLAKTFKPIYLSLFSDSKLIGFAGHNNAKGGPKSIPSIAKNISIYIGYSSVPFRVSTFYIILFI